MTFSLAYAQSEHKLLTWNTFLIPPPWNMTKQMTRTSQMVEKLPQLDYDVIFFQETFLDKARRKLIQSLKASHPFILVPQKGKRLYHLQDSGLFVASRFPAVLKDVVIFEDCAKADCLSSKSAILVEITFPGEKRVQFINTHLQAWNEPKTINIRRQQLLAIKVMMRRHTIHGVPQILTGDLNVDGNITGEYEASLELMGMSSGPLIGEIQASNGFPTHDCFKKPGEDGPGEWLDHFWLKEPSDIQISSRRVIPLYGILSGQECPLSDHHAVEATLSL
jgi:endonuclease/exonuclease/phosphatase family metal-dependent hydrolase